MSTTIRMTGVSWRPAKSVQTLPVEANRVAVKRSLATGASNRAQDSIFLRSTGRSSVRAMVPGPARAFTVYRRVHSTLMLGTILAVSRGQSSLLERSARILPLTVFPSLCPVLRSLWFYCAMSIRGRHMVSSTQMILLLAVEVVQV